MAAQIPDSRAREAARDRRYPEVSLADARIASNDAKAALRAGQDPSAAKRLQRQFVSAMPAATFEALAREWHALNKRKWTERHAADVIGSLERLLFPPLGALDVNAITPRLLIPIIRQIEERHGPETARRVRQRMHAVYAYALAHEIAETNPAVIVKDVMAPAVRGWMPAVTTLDAARDVLVL